jgi:integrase/recombinase XerD
VDGSAPSGRGIGQGDRGRQALLPVAFGATLDAWLPVRPTSESGFAKAPEQPPASAQVARAYLWGMLQKAGIEKKISPHKLRQTYATNLLNAGAERVDIKALLGHSTINTTRLTLTWGRRGWSRGW